MGQYDAYLICENGHGVNESYHKHPLDNEKYCTKCGARTIKACPNCGHEIRGYYSAAGILMVSGPTPVPNICFNCGVDFPWRSRRKKLSESLKSDSVGPTISLETLMDRFHLVVKQLGQRHADRGSLDISDEYDVQDLFHSLLHIYYDDIRAEEWNPSYAGGSTRSDFLLKEEQIVIEVKKTRPSLKTKELGEQLIIDIAKYRNHPDCKTLYCFVYDPDSYIRNPKGLENDLNDDTGNMKVKVKIVPKGH